MTPTLILSDNHKCIVVLVPTSSSTMHSETMALLMRQVALLSESCVVRIGAMAKRVFEPLQCEAHQHSVSARSEARCSTSYH